MGDHSDVPPWTRRILPLNFYTKFFRADVFYRIMTEREKERKDQMEEEKNEERERVEGKRKREKTRRASTWTSRRIYFSCGNTRARENERNRERGGEMETVPISGKPDRNKRESCEMGCGNKVKF